MIFARMVLVAMMALVGWFNYRFWTGEWVWQDANWFFGVLIFYASLMPLLAAGTTLLFSFMRVDQESNGGLMINSRNRLWRYVNWVGLFDANKTTNICRLFWGLLLQIVAGLSLMCGIGVAIAGIIILGIENGATSILIGIGAIAGVGALIFFLANFVEYAIKKYEIAKFIFIALLVAFLTVGPIALLMTDGEGMSFWWALLYYLIGLASIAVGFATFAGIVYLMILASESLTKKQEHASSKNPDQGNFVGLASRGIKEKFCPLVKIM